MLFVKKKKNTSDLEDIYGKVTVTSPPHRDLLPPLLAALFCARKRLRLCPCKHVYPEHLLQPLSPLPSVRVTSHQPVEGKRFSLMKVFLEKYTVSRVSSRLCSSLDHVHVATEAPQSP